LTAPRGCFQILSLQLVILLARHRGHRMQNRLNMRRFLRVPHHPAVKTLTDVLRTYHVVEKTQHGNDAQDAKKHSKKREFPIFFSVKNEPANFQIEPRRWSQ
jgi:hypothetical protein